MNASKVWITQDGREIPIRQMPSDHLKNAIWFLQRRTEAVKSSLPFPLLNGEMAQMFAEQDYYRAQEAEPDSFFPIYKDLVKEAVRRGLDLTRPPLKESSLQSAVTAGTLRTLQRLKSRGV